MNNADKINMIMWRIEACDISISILEKSITDNPYGDSPGKASREEQLQNFQLIKIALKKAIDELN